MQGLAAAATFFAGLKYSAITKLAVMRQCSILGDEQCSFAGLKYSAFTKLAMMRPCGILGDEQCSFAGLKYPAFIQHKVKWGSNGFQRRNLRHGMGASAMSPEFGL